ncbi:glycosyltransferase [Paracoccus sp. (in: a-proteobacteria)]|uniref:glycosyltransferase n=1 Tax=Paracoccus sp. TaxID=267 RepID=UPI00396CFBE6
MNHSIFSVILPAHQEEHHILNCLNALCSQDLVPDVRHEVIVVANGCTDATAQLARGCAADFAAAGWDFQVLETPVGNKINALNMGDEAAAGDIRLYLDADIVVGPGMVTALYQTLNGSGARYAGARLVVPQPVSRISAAYARFWQRLPFVRTGVTGAGLFAVNAEGRARWSRFPDIISDDGFARLNFAPHERQRVDVPYLWPITEGFRPLVRVRRRQDAGNAELARRFPALFKNVDGDRPPMKQALRLGMIDPTGFLAYAAVALGVRIGPPSQGWDRNR